jgi:hypothetical protein
VSKHVIQMRRHYNRYTWLCSCGRKRSNWTWSRNNVIWGGDRHVKLATRQAGEARGVGAGKAGGE